MFNQYCRTELGKIGPSDFQYRGTGKQYESKNGSISNIYLNSYPILDQFIPNVIAMINKTSQYEPIIGPIFVLVSKEANNMNPRMGQYLILYLNSCPILNQFLPNVIAMINKASQYEPLIGPMFVLLSK